MATQIGGRQINLSKSPITGANTSLLHNSARGLELTGSVLLKAAPTVDLEAATKKYVDDNTGSATVGVDEVVFGKTGGGFDSLPAVKLVNGSQTGDGALDVVLDLSTTGSFRSSARMFQVTGSVNVAEAISLKTSAGHTASTIAIVNAANTSDGAILIDAEAGGVTIAAGNDSLILDADGTDNDALDIDSAGGMDVDVVGILDINAGDDSVIAVTTEAKDLALTVSGGGAQVLQLNSAGTGTDAIDINATGGGIDVDANGVLALDGAGGIDIGKTADVAIDVDADTFDLDASGAVTIDGAGIALAGGANASSFNVATGGADAKDLTISVTGGGDSSLLLSSAGTGADAMSLDVTAGGMVIAASLADEKVLAIGNASSTQLTLSPSATSDNELIALTNAAGTAANAIDVAATAGGIDISAAGGAGKGIDLNMGGTSILSLNTTAGGGIVGGAVATSFQQATQLVLPSYFEVSGSSTGNGTTTSFSTNAAAVASSIRVYLNGVRQEVNGATTNDYSLGTDNAVVFETAPVQDDLVIIEWRQGTS